MIRLKPNPYHQFICPECKSRAVDVKGFAFPGIHVLADCICQNCKSAFYHDFPIGHSLLYPEIISKDGARYYTPDHKSFSKRFLKIFRNKNTNEIQITKKVYKESKEIILLNCLDVLYGHSLLKLLNAQHYLEQFQQMGVVVLITKNFEWLIPEGVAETWVVELPMSQTEQWLVKVDEYVQREILRFETVYLSLAFSLPDPAEIKIEKFTRVKKFDLSKFEKEEFTITFILREDRYWHQNSMEKFFRKAALKLNVLKSIKWFFIWRQDLAVKKTISKIKKGVPGAVFNIAGLGKTGNFPGYVNDLRKQKVNEETEFAWCRIYAQSHLAVGVHGSNMLLPSALAGGFVEIFPADRLGNFLQDLLSPYTKRELQYFGRFADEYIRPGNLAEIILSVRENYRSFCVTMKSEYLQHQIYEDVSKWSR